ncbi:tumor necrosis factor receptor superfamily member 4 [Nothobranchius furzeri]|uniref:Tumor necrosis factor receptor superfamily member 9 n=2 Tax=Nothobranchius furzeri TaxID=105023 RepID=A0A9D3BH56_NOTFU|nr:tumor necrosis factor receptor superfamily member 9 [Nothobranchius furzeri]
MTDVNDVVLENPLPFREFLSHSQLVAHSEHPGTAGNGRPNMLQLNLFVLILTFGELILDLNGLMCEKGHRIAFRKSTCEPCPDGYFQPIENDTGSCLGCVECNEKSGSSTDRECTLLTNRKCKCRDGFVPLTEDSVLCRCDPGFGLQDGVCSKCKEGSFSKTVNSPCKEWTHCPAGVKQSGSATSDVICNESKINPPTVKPSTPHTPHIFAVITTRRPHEGDHTLRTDSITTPTSSQQDNVPTTSQSNTRNQTGVVILLLGIAGLLVWTAITCKMHITLCKRKTKQNKDSLCRRPVEESGDSHESVVKLNLEP